MDELDVQGARRNARSGRDPRRGSMDDLSGMRPRYLARRSGRPGIGKRGYIDYVAREKKKITDIRQISPIDSTFDGFRVTGYYYADYFNENIDFIKRLQPEVTRIAFCYDDRYAHDFFEPYLSQLVASHPPLELDYLVGSRLSTQELLKSIFAMDSSYALLTGGWYTDRNRYPHAYSMLHNELTRHSTKNMYQLQEQDLTEANYIGGYFVSGKELGRDIAGLTYSVLTEGIENSPAFGPTPVVAPASRQLQNAPQNGDRSVAAPRRHGTAQHRPHAVGEISGRSRSRLLSIAATDRQRDLRAGLPQKTRATIQKKTRRRCSTCWDRCPTWSSSSTGR